MQGWNVSTVTCGDGVSCLCPNSSRSALLLSNLTKDWCGLSLGSRAVLSLANINHCSRRVRRPARIRWTGRCWPGWANLPDRNKVEPHYYWFD